MRSLIREIDIPPTWLALHLAGAWVLAMVSPPLFGRAGDVLGAGLVALGAVLMAVAGVLTFGAIKKREGRKEARADAAAEAARETIKAHEVRNEVEDRIAAGGNARDRLRSDWRE